MASQLSSSKRNHALHIHASNGNQVKFWGQGQYHSTSSRSLQALLFIAGSHEKFNMKSSLNFIVDTTMFDNRVDIHEDWALKASTYENVQKNRIFYQSPALFKEQSYMLFRLQPFLSHFQNESISTLIHDTKMHKKDLNDN